ncbi:MAG: uroporphyrinogen decarboxylase family protein [Pirellulales bacterium]|nr:uroporphyrinogen decarboxylase family protein [Pirellulales bacterium]
MSFSSPWDRFLAAARREPVDHVPVALIGTARFFSGVAGVDQSDFYYDPSVMIEAQKTTFDRFPDVAFVPGCWPDYGVGFFTALGMRAEWIPNDTCATRDHRYDNTDRLAGLRMPDPATDGLWPWYLKTLRRFAERGEEFEGRLGCLWSMGPGEVASYLAGLMTLVEGFHTDPEFVERLLVVSTDLILRWLDAQLEVLPGAQAALITDDVSGLVSEPMYRKFLLPHHRRIRERYPELVLVFHNDTRSDHILEAIADTGFDVFQLGQTTSLPLAKETIGRRMALMGNVDTVAVLQDGTVDDVRASSRRCLAEAGAGGGFILSAGGGMNRGIQPEKIDAMVECAREFKP